MPRFLDIKIKLTVSLKSRIISGIKKFKNVLGESLELGINRFNTATVVIDMLKEILGYDKYSEIISDYGIKSSSCVAAVKKSGKLLFLLDIYPVEINVMPIQGLQLDSYGQYQNMDYVVVTNGIYWKVFIIDWGNNSSNLDCEFDFMNLDPKNLSDLKKLQKLCRENL
jgi:hypothetical protein